MRLRFLAVLATTAALAACSSSSSDSSGTTGSGGGATTSTTTATTSTGATTGSGGAGGGVAQCTPPGAMGSGQSFDVGTIKAIVTDPGGAPIAGLVAQVCGLDLCLNGATGPSGGVSIAANKTLEQPAFKIGDGLQYGKLAIPLTGGDQDFGTLVTAKLPDGVAFPASGDAESNGLVLTIAPGTTVTVDELVYDTPDAQKFRAATVPVDQAKLSFDAALGFEILYVAAPLETTFCPAVKATVPNTPNWAPGTAVEFYVEGLDVVEQFAPYGGWAKVSDGVVSDDGKTVSTSDGAGLPVLSTLAVRKKP